MPNLQYKNSKYRKNLKNRFPLLVDLISELVIEAENLNFFAESEHDKPNKKRFKFEKIIRTPADRTDAILELLIGNFFNNENEDLRKKNFHEAYREAAFKMADDLAANPKLTRRAAAEKYIGSLPSRKEDTDPEYKIRKLLKEHRVTAAKIKSGEIGEKKDLIALVEVDSVSGVGLQNIEKNELFDIHMLRHWLQKYRVQLINFLKPD